MTITQQRKYAFWFGVTFIILLFASFILIFLLEIYKIANLFVIFVFFFRVVLAASLAGVAATIPGYFDIEWSKRLGLRAGGAFAVFLIVYLVNPPQLISDLSEEARISNLFVGCDQLRGGVEASSDTKNYCIQLGTQFPDDWRANIGLAKLRSVEKDHLRSLEFSLRALGAFHSNNGVSVFDAAADRQSEFHFDARTILHTLNVTAWGAGAFDFSDFLLNAQIDAGMIDEEERRFLGKFNTAQATARFIKRYDPADLMLPLRSDYDYESFYDACLLSWLYMLEPKRDLLEASMSKYINFKAQLESRDGTNAPTQRDHLICLEGNYANYGKNCGSSIGVPTYCPIFHLIADLRTSTGGAEP